MITLDTINSAFHSIEIANAAGQALAIDGSGYLTANINGTIDVAQSGTWNIGTVDTITNAVTIVDGGGSITVDGTVAATQSGTWDIGTLTSITNDVNIADGGNSITVDAVDLDIRDLSNATDSVTAHQGGSWSFTLDNISSWKNTVEAVTTSAAEIVSSPLTGRNKMIIQNLSSKDVWVGPDNTVTTSNGLKIPKGASFEINLDTGADIYAISNGSVNILVSEYAA